MRRFLPFFALVAGLGFFSCGPQPDPEAAAPAVAEAPDAPPLDAEDPTILKRPFTADEIRGEWTVGLQLVMLQTTPDGEQKQRWTVVRADDEGCEIEFAMLDDHGKVAGEPTVERTGWVELRDHATFKADVSTREDVTRETPLGTLDGWLYTVRDDEAGTVTEYFFAKSLPGAPVHMRIQKDGATILEMTQVDRKHMMTPD